MGLEHDIAQMRSLTGQDGEQPVTGTAQLKMIGTQDAAYCCKPRVDLPDGPHLIATGALARHNLPQHLNMQHKSQKLAQHNQQAMAPASLQHHKGTRSCRIQQVIGNANKFLAMP